MEYVEIKSSHNIVLQFQLASPFERVVSTIIDYFLLLLFFFFINITFIDNNNLIPYIGITIFSVYHPTMEFLWNGQSVGKKIMGIQVIALDGKPVTLKSYILRWVFRVLEVVATLGTMAVVAIAVSGKNQRVGDFFADTTVIRIRNQSQYSINNLEKLENIERKITFPEIIKFNDEDMLLVKYTLERLNQNTSTTTIQFALKVADKIKEELNIKESGMSLKTFLTTALEDYIILTR